MDRIPESPGASPSPPGPGRRKSTVDDDDGACRHATAESRRSRIGDRVLASLGCFGGRKLDVKPSEYTGAKGGQARRKVSGHDEVIRRISTLHAMPPQELVGQPSRERVSQQFSQAKRVATLRRYVRTGSRIAIGFKSLEELEDASNDRTASNSSVGTSYTDIKQAQVRLRHRLEQMGLEQVTMGDDGNCQFRALSWQLYGTQNLHGNVRERVVRWIREHADAFMPYFDGKEDFQDYLAQMAKKRTWGDELTLRAATDCFNRKVHVITTEERNWYLSYVPLEGKEGHQGHVFLTYISPIHYNTVNEV